MKVSIEFECGDDALSTDFENEVRYVLDRAKYKLVEQFDRVPATVCTAPEAADKLLDSNGNTIGFVRLEK
jgi:hypothetical protein